MNILKNLVLQSSGKKPIVYDLYFKQNNTRKPVVIFCHGYKGFKDWGAWHLVAEAFAEAGFFFIKMNFSHNGGTPEQPIDFPDLEAFAQNNYTKELDDLQRVLTMATTSNFYGDETNPRHISLIGHSRGGGIVLIKAEESALVKKVVTWAGVSDYKVRFQESSEAFKAWKDTGRTHVENGRTKQQMPHDWQFYEDFIQNEERLTIKRAVKALKKPFLIVHGSDDPTVPISEAKQLKNWNNDASLIVIHGADHVFGASHPWTPTEMPKDIEIVVNETIRFIKRVSS